MATKKKRTTKPSNPVKKKPVATKATADPVIEAVPEVVPDVQEPEAKPNKTPVPETKTQVPEPMATEEPEAAPVHAQPFSPPLRDPRLPEPGTVITRQYKGTVIEVKVLEAGFELAGESFSSISKVAAAATGNKTASLNGFAFFRLGTIPGGKSRSGAGTAARLRAKINKIEGLVVKMRTALAEGAQALADAEAETEKMKGEVEEV